MRGGTSGFVLALALALALALPIGSVGAEQPTAASATQTRESQSAMTPDQALQLLREGNERFVAGLTLRRDLSEQVRATQGGQFPYAAILGCIDSRVPPELVFDTGIGDVFAARIAGNVPDDEVLGSLEFATQVAGARLVVVLGHTACGAVKGACDGVKLGHLTELLAQLAPAIAASKDVPGPHDSSNPDFVQHVTEANVRLTTKALRERSEILRELAAGGRLKVVGAIYDVASGRVTFLE